MKLRVWIGLLSVVLLMSGCAASNKTGGVAIPGITTSSAKSEPTMEATDGLPTSVAVLPFLNSTGKEEAFHIVRTTMFNHFASLHYRALHLSDVDQRLQAAGWPDATHFQDVDAVKLMKTLGVNGLLYGEITHFDRIFLGIYAQIAIGVRLRLINQDGKEIWHGEDTVRTHAGGISTTPVGLILDAIAAATHLTEVNMYRAADDLGRELIPLMPQPKVLQTAQPPKILQVVHDGVGRILNYGDSLKIAMQGEPGKKAFARIKGWKTIDLTEGEPGFYTATVMIAPDDEVRNGALYGVLQDNQGLQGEQVSPLGLVNVDNQPPAAVNGLTASSSADGIVLNWQAAGDDLYGFVITASDQELGDYQQLAEVHDHSYRDRTAQPFQTRHYRVVALDRAGNASTAVHVRGRLLADSRFASATPLPSNLPAAVNGVAVLRAADSPFQLNAALTVPAGSTLLIEPGVRITASAKGALIVEGALLAQGSQKMPIVLAASQGGAFQGITLSSTASVQLQQVTIDGAAIGIRIDRGAPLIDHCRIVHSQFNAMDIGGMSRPQIRNSVIDGATSSGVLISGKAQPQFHGNRFANNQPFHMQSGSSYRIDARGNQWQPAASPSTILGNVDYAAKLLP